MGRPLAPTTVQTAASLLDTDHAARDDHNGCADDHHPAGYLDNRAHNYNRGPDIDNNDGHSQHDYPDAYEYNAWRYYYDHLERPDDRAAVPEVPASDHHDARADGDDSEVADHHGARVDHIGPSCPLYGAFYY